MDLLMFCTSNFDPLKTCCELNYEFSLRTSQGTNFVNIRKRSKGNKW